MLLIEVDGEAANLDAEADAVVAACVDAGATARDRAPDGPKRDELWRIRRELSPALKTIATFKLNNDVVVPRARVPQLFALIERLRAEIRVADSRVRARGRRQHPRQHHGARRQPTRRR